MGLSQQFLYPHLIHGAPQHGTLQLNNLTAYPLSGITATVVSGPADVQAQFSPPSSLAANGSGQISYTLSATGSTPAWAQFIVQFTSAEGASVTLYIGSTMSEPTPALATIPDSLTSSMVEGGQALVTFVPTNSGGAASGPLWVSVPDGASWLSVVTAQPIPALAVDQSCPITLALTPSTNLQLGRYTGDFVVQD